VVYFENWLIGEERFLDPIFPNRLREFNEMTLSGKASANIQLPTPPVSISNGIDVKIDEIGFPQKFTFTPWQSGSCCA
jgi:hypothetical protein